MLVALASSALAVSVLAGSPARSASYSEARDAFDETYTLEQRLTAQVLLIAAGYSLVVPSTNLSQGTYEAIRSFEAQNGFAASGMLNARQLEALAISAAPALRLWGFQKVDFAGRAIWVPLGLGMTATEVATERYFRDRRGRLSIDLVSLGDRSVERAHARFVAEALAHSGVVRADNYSRGDKWFAASSTWADGSEHIVRVQQDGSGSTGFTLAWPTEAGDVHAERIAAIMSGSLRSAMLDQPFPEPPSFVSAAAPPGR